MTAMLTTVTGPERQPAAQTGTGRQGLESRQGRQGKNRSHHRRLAAGAHSGAPVAAGAMVLVCVMARLPDRLLRVTGLRGWVGALVGVLALVSGARVVAQAPFTLAVREGSVARWAVDQIKLLVVTIGVGAVLTVPLYALFRASTSWWLWAWALFAMVTLAGQAAMPLIVRVQTGHLSPAPPRLALQVGAIAARAGVDIARGGGGGVLVADTPAKKGPRCNAYVVGYGPTRRVVLEAGIAAWPPELLDQVVAHEIGHVRHRHTATRVPIMLIAQLATFAMASALLSFRPLMTWVGVSGIGDPRSYPFLLALTVLLALPARLVLAAFDRAQERAADQFALALLADPLNFAAMLDRAGLDGDAPRHLGWWRSALASHPPIGERMLACQRFMAEFGAAADVDAAGVEVLR